MPPREKTVVTPGHLTPNVALGSILRASPLCPADKIKCAARLCFSEDLGQLARRLGRSRQHLTEVINGTRPDSLSLRRDLAVVFRVQLTDIWPASSTDSTSTLSGPDPQNHDPQEERG